MTGGPGSGLRCIAQGLLAKDCTRDIPAHV
jgi:hypothetical protein